MIPSDRSSGHHFRGARSCPAPSSGAGTASTPDARLVAKARRALAVWEHRAEEPTSNLVGTGAIAELERGAAELLGCRHALSLPSATLGLRVALDAVGVRSGERVLVPAYDWTAALSAVESLGAVAVPVDVELPGCGMDPAALDAALAAGAEAVIVTHLFGVPARIEELVATCRSRGVRLIEDCSQSLGARVEGGSVGSFGDLAVCSFGPTKLLDAEDGGVVATNDRWLFERCVRRSQHPVRQKLLGVEDINLATLALRLHPLAAVLGVAALDDIGRTLERRRTAMAELAHELERQDWSHAVRAGISPIGPALAVLDDGRPHPVPTGVAFGPPGQHVIRPRQGADAPIPRAQHVEHRVLLAHRIRRSSEVGEPRR